MSRVGVFIVAIFCAGPAFGQTAYFAAIPDLPVAPGLSESADPTAHVFTGDHADFFIAQAHGPVPVESVERFYQESLSALGWSYSPAPREQGRTFQRGRERLVLFIEPRDGGTKLRVRLIVGSSPNGD